MQGHWHKNFRGVRWGGGGTIIRSKSCKNPSPHSDSGLGWRNGHTTRPSFRGCPASRALR